MTDTITLSGLVATEPRHLTTAEGLPVTSFRLASHERKFDKKLNTWVDAGTNWYTVATYRHLAKNAMLSVHKGDRVLVTGRLHIRGWETPQSKGTNIEIDADTLGHDLRLGTATFARTINSTTVDELEQVAAAPTEPATPAEPAWFSVPDSEMAETSASSRAVLEAQATPF